MVTLCKKQEVIRQSKRRCEWNYCNYVIINSLCFSHSSKSMNSFTKNRTKWKVWLKSSYLFLTWSSTSLSACRDSQYVNSSLVTYSTSSTERFQRLRRRTSFSGDRKWSCCSKRRVNLSFATYFGRWTSLRTALSGTPARRCIALTTWYLLALLRRSTRHCGLEWGIFSALLTNCRSLKTKPLWFYWRVCARETPVDDSSTSRRS